MESCEFERARRKNEMRNGKTTDKDTYIPQRRKREKADDRKRETVRKGERQTG